MMKPENLVAGSICLTILLLGAWTNSLAGEPPDIEINDQAPLVDMSDPEKCLNLRRVKKTKIINDQVILFYANGNKIYRNTMQRKCPGLRQDSTISYTTSMSRLCRHDRIRVLERFGGGFSTGASCSLGYFEQIPNLEDLQQDID